MVSTKEAVGGPRSGVMTADILPLANRLARLTELERRYDGPIPWRERATAFFGDPRVVLLMEAQGRVAFYRQHAVEQLTKVIWPRRREGTCQAYMLADLRLYIREARAAERDTARLQAEVDEIMRELCPDAALARAAE